MDAAAVWALFSDYSPTLTRTAAELEAALHRRGYAGLLADWLPTLRASGLREPRRGVFGAPVSIDNSREIAGNFSEVSDNSRNKAGTAANAPGEAGSDVESATNQQPEQPHSRHEAGTLATPAMVSILSGLTADNSNKAVMTGPPEPPRFSYFRGGIRTAAPYTTITPHQLWEMVHGPQFATATNWLREAPAGSEQRAERKRALDYVTPAGTFAPTRANGNLQTPSGLLVLDFDHLPDVAAARAALLSDALLQPGLVLLFTSPGGEGLKALLEADPAASHLDNFRALSGYLAGCYGPELQPDPSGKDVARACFVCHDAAAWLSPRFGG
ncbi:BT4734/BF3469 family protein [Hymenobacter sediminicola]|uniref:BT4734-like N-terminal domain-containing protein n=1 Tax=Hymenobacter sediminicola TaxID=2761579 RepID=A0A7G7W3Q5_9BACT|nr:BT4734/BF3469 family protein [Hymenobacter sediminicola]QNH60998.1 hypothetical protein H4317_12490 [Hymenobacter sediminicola]